MFRKVINIIASLWLASGVVCSAKDANNVPASTAAATRFKSVAPVPSEAITFARQMGIGWNLGNTLEATGDWIKSTSTHDYETAWGNPVTTKAMIDGIKASGFKTVRIP